MISLVIVRLQLLLYAFKYLAHSYYEPMIIELHTAFVPLGLRFTLAPAAQWVESSVQKSEHVICLPGHGCSHALCIAICVAQFEDTKYCFLM